MATILGLHGFNKSGSSVNKLFAAYGNDVVDVATGLGYGLALNGNSVEMDTFLDHVFLQNYDTTPITFNGSAWTKEYVPRVMTSKYIKTFRTKARIYLGNLKFSGPQAPLDKDGNAIMFPSNIAFCDLFIGNTLTWGMEWGQNGKTIAGSPYLNLDTPLIQDFVASNIKVGDPLVITNGNAALLVKPYTVKTIISPYRLEMTENFPVTATGLHYWVGNNYLAIATDDNDQITGIGENQNRVIPFKLMSLWLYSGSQLIQVKDAVGTSSARSIINKKGFTYYFHGSDPKISGIYRFDGVNSSKISRSIDPYIEGMSTSNYSSVISWEEGEEVRFFLGDITNTNYDISVTNAVATLNTVTGAWDVSPIADIITARTTFRTSNRRDTYLGTSNSQILQMQDGYSHNGTPSTFRYRTKIFYPSGSEVVNEFTAIQAVGRQTRGIKLQYRVVDTPQTISDWIGLGELTDDKTELTIPRGNKFGSGIQLEFYESSTTENDYFLEKYTIFYRPAYTKADAKTL